MNQRKRIKDLYAASVIPSVCAGEGIKDLVSVLIPTYNRAHVLFLALDSVLKQDYPHFEIIVVDDGSKDTTEARMTEYLAKYSAKLQYIKKENGGLVSARNAGLALAKGEYIAFQDSDDIWLPEKLSAQVEVLKRNSDIAICWNQIHSMDEQGHLLKENAIADFYNIYNVIDIDARLPRQKEIHCSNGKVISYRKGDIFPILLLGNLVHPPDAVMRRSAIQKAGGLDQAYSFAGEDYEFFWRVSANGLGAMLDKAGIYYRIGASDQMTNINLLLFVALGYEKILKDRLKKYPSVFSQFGAALIKQQRISSLRWVAKSEFTSPYGKKLNGLRALAELATYSPAEALRTLPALIELSLPKFIRNFARKIFNKTHID